MCTPEFTDELGIEKLLNNCSLQRKWKVARPSVIDRIDSKQMFTPLTPKNLWICCFTWQRGINVTDKIKFSNQLILKIGRLSWIIWPGPIVTTRVPKEEEKEAEASEWCDGRVNQPPLVLKMEGTLSKKWGRVFRHWNRLSFRVSRLEGNPSQHFILAQWDPVSF